jgi:hypothetical protein
MRGWAGTQLAGWLAGCGHECDPVTRRARDLGRWAAQARAMRAAAARAEAEALARSREAGLVLWLEDHADLTHEGGGGEAGGLTGLTGPGIRSAEEWVALGLAPAEALRVEQAAARRLALRMEQPAAPSSERQREERRAAQSVLGIARWTAGAEAGSTPAPSTAAADGQTRAPADATAATDDDDDDDILIDGFAGSEVLELMEDEPSAPPLGQQRGVGVVTEGGAPASAPLTPPSAHQHQHQHQLRSGVGGVGGGIVAAAPSPPSPSSAQRRQWR